MKNYLYCLLCLFSFNAFAIGALTNIKPGITIYSEYYPNPTAKFKGTIIFENGSGTDISEWKNNKTFFHCIKKLGSIFLYDRNGLGKSPPDFQLSSNNPMTAKLVSDKLSILLKKLNIKPPYVIVGHSYGAMYAGYFILSNHNLIKAVLWIDPVPRDYHFSSEILRKYKKGVEAAHRKSSTYIYKKYNGPYAEVIYQILGFDASKRSVRQLGNINNETPIVIISATGMEIKHPIREDWYTSQKQWLNKNPLSKIIRVSSDHFIQLNQPQIVCNELKQLIN